MLLRRVDVVVGAGGPDLCLVDEIIGIALREVVVGDGVPGAGDRADLLVDEGIGALEERSDEVLQTVVVGVAGLEIRAGDADVPAVLVLAEGGVQRMHGGLGCGNGDLAVGALREGEDGLTEGGAAAVHNEDVLAVLVLQGDGVSLMVVAGQQHVNAGGMRCKVAALVLLIVDVRIALAAVHGDDDVVALLLHFLAVVVFPLIDIGLFGVVGMAERAALIVAGDVPVRVVHVLEAQQTDGEGRAVLELVGEGLVRGEHGFVRLRLHDVRADDVDGLTGDGLVRGGQQIVVVPLNLRRIVELVVAQHKGIIANVAQRSRHGAVFAALLENVVAAQRASLQNVANIDKNAVVHGGTALCDELCCLQEVVAQGAVCVGVPVVCTAVHIGGRHDADGDRIGLRLEDVILDRGIRVAFGCVGRVDRGQLGLCRACRDHCHGKNEADHEQKREKTLCNVFHFKTPLFVVAAALHDFGNRDKIPPFITGSVGNILTLCKEIVKEAGRPEGKIGRTDKEVLLREADFLFVKNSKNCAKRRCRNVFLHFLQQREPQRVRRDFDRKNRKILDNMLHMQYKKRAVLLGTARKPPFGILTMRMKSYMESRRKRARFSPARRPGSSSH